MLAATIERLLYTKRVNNEKNSIVGLSPETDLKGNFFRMCGQKKGETMPSSVSTIPQRSCESIWKKGWEITFFTDTKNLNYKPYTVMLK